MELKSLAPVIFVEAIEPCLSFWTEKLGFAVAAEVKPADRLGFVLLAKGPVVVMYQSYESIAEDMRTLEERDRRTSVVLYVDTDDLEAVERALEGETIVVPRRTTFYGAKETGYREPGGNVVVFAQHDR